jgi:folate-binding protein YgfZ
VNNRCFSEQDFSMSASRQQQLQRELEALTRSVAVGSLARTQIEITGRDRSTFLNGFCTNDIKRLVPGGGCEAFMTNVQGKTIGYIYVFCGTESLVIDSAAGQAQAIIEHLDHYRVREQVVLHDRSNAWHELLVSGPQSAACLQQVCGAEVPVELFCHATVPFRDQSVHVRRVPFLHPECLFVSGDGPVLADLQDQLVTAGAVACGIEALDIRRVESGSPLFGVDISRTNLPQEIDRNATAISFRKGCYLGQETVARLDALGHVNWRLRGIKFPGPVPPIAGTELQTAEKSCARITSVVESVQLQTPLALAYVRAGLDLPGSTWPTQFGTVEVVALPHQRDS